VAAMPSRASEPTLSLVTAMKLSADKLRLIALLHEAGALQFGSFVLRSGRVSPYFFNARKFDTGTLVAELGRHYARAIRAAAPRATIVFGPAYAGISIAVSAAMALSTPKRSIGYLFNRKEAKAHGDRGVFVGATPGKRDRLALVDDVISDGGTKREAVALLRGAFPTTPLDALIIAFDRQERDAEGGYALRSFHEATGVPVVALLTLEELIAALAPAEPKRGARALAGLPRLTRAQHQALLDYKAEYGVTLEDDSAPRTAVRRKSGSRKPAPGKPTRSKPSPHP
jgi:orotate phosphoribosyltransferase